MKKITGMAGIAAGVLMMTGCGIFPKQSSYEKVDEGQALEIPPDLSTPNGSAALRVPDATYSAVSGAAVSRNPVDPLENLSGVKLIELEGEQLLALSDNTDSVFRRLGLALDRVGLEVESQDPETSSYQVKYVDQTAKEQRPGVFSRWFLRKKGPVDHSGTYRLSVKQHNEAISLIKVSGKDAGRVADKVLDDVLVSLRDRMG